MADLTLKLTVTVQYDTHGVDPEYLKRNLASALETAMGEGLLTGSSEAEVDDYSIKVSEPRITPEDLIVWPDGSNCFRYELHEYGWKSDDYEVVIPGSGVYQALVGYLK